MGIAASSKEPEEENLLVLFDKQVHRRVHGQPVSRRT